MSAGRQTHSVTDDTVPQRAVQVGRQRAAGARPAQVRLSQMVTWTVASGNPVAGVVHWAQRGTARIRGRVAVPDAELDPVVDATRVEDDLADLEIVQKRLLAPGLGGGPRLLLNLAGARIQQGRRRRDLDLADLWLDAAGPVPGQVGPRKAPDTIWEAVVSGADSELVVRGWWLHLAALGTLAGWAEPA